MRANIIRIGNSQGVRIPNPFLEQCDLEGSVEMNVENNAVVIAPAKGVREGWSDAFKMMAEHGDDAPLLDESDLTSEDVTELGVVKVLDALS